MSHTPHHTPPAPFLLLPRHFQISWIGISCFWPRVAKIPSLAGTAWPGSKLIGQKRPAPHTLKLPYWSADIPVCHTSLTSSYLAPPTCNKGCYAGAPRRKLWGAQRGTTCKKISMWVSNYPYISRSRFPGSNLERAGSLIDCYTENKAFYGTEVRTLHRVYHKYVGSFEMWCGRTMEKISWTDRRRNEKVLHRVQEERNVLN